MERGTFENLWGASSRHVPTPVRFERVRSTVVGGGWTEADAQAQVSTIQEGGTPCCTAPERSDVTTRA